MLLSYRKLTRNVHRWLTLTTFLILATSLSGCASLSLFGEDVKPIEVKTTAVEKTILDIQLPDPVNAAPIEWKVITPENIDQVWKELQDQGQPLVVFAMTPKGYESLSLTVGELRNLIATQRAIIIKYKEYYEPAKEPTGQNTKN
jgi:hypothetical protein